MNTLAICSRCGLLCLILRPLSSYSELPSGFEHQKRERADSVAERLANNERIREMLTSDVKVRQQIRALPGGLEALTALYKLESAHEKRERELLQPVEAIREQYAEVLRDKLKNDSVYQERDKAAAQAQNEMKQSQSSALLLRLRSRLTDENGGRQPSKEELLAAIHESVGKAKLREILQAQDHVRKEVWRLCAEAGRRRREIERTDPHLLEIKQRETSLLLELKTNVLAHNEQMQRLADEITAAKREVEYLKIEASEEQTGSGD